MSLVQHPRTRLPTILKRDACAWPLALFRHWGGLVSSGTDQAEQTSLLTIERLLDILRQTEV